MRVEYFTEQGRRKVNEDYILSKNNDKNISLHIVADGMGGYSKGDIASETVANCLFELLLKDCKSSDYNTLIDEAINKANIRISELNIKQNTKMGTTIAGILIDKSSAYMFWVGDVKILHIRNEKTIFESTDHSRLWHAIRT